MTYPATGSGVSSKDRFVYIVVSDGVFDSRRCNLRFIGGEVSAFLYYLMGQ